MPDITVNGRTYTTAPETNLKDANLRGAYLKDANLRGAYLKDAYLRGAYLGGANLRGAYLKDANLKDANLRGANLKDAYLQDADLQDANLQDANLQGAYLGGANLQGANLQGAYLGGANLQDANLQDVKNIPPVVAAQLSILPEQGGVFGWKKAHSVESCNQVIVKLYIPASAKRSNATGRKCRAEYAKVLSITGADAAYSDYDPSFIYRAGETVRPTEPFDEDRFAECASGIHFFITRAEAEAHLL